MRSSWSEAVADGEAAVRAWLELELRSTARIYRRNCGSDEAVTEAQVTRAIDLQRALLDTLAEHGFSASDCECWSISTGPLDVVLNADRRDR